ncbi:MAG: hypothetical protein LPJ89_07900 [Hymenobacteraceae bacterium]|nr:hypothetical protein [Hymenobacteraceae bacterium]
MRKVLGSFLLILVSAVSAWAHDYHVSLAEAKWNSQSQRYEVALKVFTDDLQAALSRKTGKEVKLKNSPETQAQIEQYLKQHFWLEVKNGIKHTGTVIGFEEEADVTWIYFEIKAPAARQFRWHNSVFVEQYPDQVNILNLSVNNKMHSLLFKKDEETKQVNL